jgi:hypothetical protein
MHQGSTHTSVAARSGSRTSREAVEFVAVSVAGGAIALLCLAVSHDLLRLTSPLADNISANVVGLALGSAFRFLGYRSWVYSRTRAARASAAPQLPAAE